ncbi:hypothetical protein [Staphylospora marina]|nr:hypothetical protein [Staphylospora marina]
MATVGHVLLAAGVILELLGLWLIYRGKNTSLEALILGLLCLLSGILTL